MSRSLFVVIFTVLASLLCACGLGEPTGHEAASVVLEAAAVEPSPVEPSPVELLPVECDGPEGEPIALGSVELSSSEALSKSELASEEVFEDCWADESKAGPETREREPMCCVCVPVCCGGRLRCYCSPC